MQHRSEAGAGQREKAIDYEAWVCGMTHMKSMFASSLAAPKARDHSGWLLEEGHDA
jgi:hypothetical protein